MQLGDSFDNGLLNLHCDIPASRIAYILRGSMGLVVVPCFSGCDHVLVIRGMRARCAWVTVTISLRIDQGVTHAIDGTALKEARRERRR